MARIECGRLSAQELLEQVFCDEDIDSVVMVVKKKDGLRHIFFSKQNDDELLWAAFLMNADLMRRLNYEQD